MHLIAKAMRISSAKFHCNRLITVQDIQDYASLIFGTQCRMVWLSGGEKIWKRHIYSFRHNTQM